MSAIVTPDDTDNDRSQGRLSLQERNECWAPSPNCNEREAAAQLSRERIPELGYLHVGAPSISKQRSNLDFLQHDQQHSQTAGKKSIFFISHSSKEEMSRFDQAYPQPWVELS